MGTFGLIDYDAASPEVRAIYDDIMATHHTDWINNFWKALAHDPAHLQRTWNSLKAIMAPGVLDPLRRAAVCGRQCDEWLCLLHCLAYGGGAEGGDEAVMFAELMAVVGMANETNRLANGYQVAIDDRFRPQRPWWGTTASRPWQQACPTPPVTSGSRRTPELLGHQQAGARPRRPALPPRRSMPPRLALHPQRPDSPHGGKNGKRSRGREHASPPRCSPGGRHGATRPRPGLRPYGAQAHFSIRKRSFSE